MHNMHPLRHTMPLNRSSSGKAAGCAAAGSATRPLQPTEPQLVWGRRSERDDRRFRARATIVEHLIATWTRPDWTAVDVSGGAGRWLATLAPRFDQFTHLDFSSDALRTARADHPEFPHVEFATADLLQPRETVGGQPPRTWDAVFCFDTLLYRGDFVETALRNIRTFVSPRGVAIIDVPMKFRATISRVIKGRHYRGPERKFSIGEMRTLVRDCGLRCVATAYQYAELGVPVHRTLSARGLTGAIPWPATWMYWVLRPGSGGSTTSARGEP